MAAKVNKGDSKVEIFKVVKGIWSPRTVGFESLMLKAVQKRKKKKEKKAEAKQLYEKLSPSGFSFMFLPPLRDHSSIQISASVLYPDKLALETKQDKVCLLLMRALFGSSFHTSSVS